MNGGYLKFLPKKQRLAVLESTKPRKVDRKKETTDNLTFIYLKYLVSYKARLRKDNCRDNTLTEGQEIKLVCDKELETFRLHTAGLPLPYQQIYDITNNKEFIFPIADLPLNRFTYSLSKHETLTTKSSPFSINQTTHHPFFRTLEGGTMIKITQKEKKLPVVHRKTTGDAIEYTDPKEIDKTLYKSFFDKINDVISEFFETINALSKTNTLYQALNDIVRKSAEYDYIRIEQTYAGAMTSSGTTQSSKKQKTIEKLGKTQPAMQSCRVAGCSMTDSDELSNIVYVLYMYRKVVEDGTTSTSTFKKTDLKKYHLSFKLCKHHGMVVITMWYLINQVGVMIFDIMNVIGVVDNHKKKYTKKSIFSHYADLITKENIAKLIKEKRKLDASLLFIAEWIGNHRHTKPDEKTHLR